MSQDEIFHYPQTRQYCAGNWQAWDPKITTFPGLYIIGVGYAKALAASERWLGVAESDQVCVLQNTTTHAAPPPQEACTLGTLRSVNVLQAVCCWLLMRLLLPLIHGPSLPASQAMLWVRIHCTQHTHVYSYVPLHTFVLRIMVTPICSITTPICFITVHRRQQSCLCTHCTSSSCRCTTPTWAPSHGSCLHTWYVDFVIQPSPTPATPPPCQLCLERQYFLTMAASALAVSFRQTNAIWAAWLLSVCAVDHTW